MMNNTYKRGFTLIELLVVIAIIGILASVVLASLNSARDKGQDAASKQQLASIRAEAEISYDNNSRSYDNVCDETAPLQANLTSGNCDDSASEWAMEALLTNSRYFCVDYTGIAEEATSTKGNNTVCN